MGLLAGTPFDRPPHCERCELPETECKCPPEEPPEPVRVPPQNQTAVLSVEKRKYGKAVTCVSGLSAADNDLKQLLSQLKSACGSGGSLKSERIELQGKHLDTVKGMLRQIGYRVKGA